MYKIILTLGLSVLATFSCFTQSSISGTIKNQSGDLLPMVSLIIHELNRTTSTNKDGSFFIDNITYGRYHLHFEAYGFKPYDIDTIISSDINLEIVLINTINELDEVIIEIDGLKQDQESASLDLRAISNENIRQQSSTSLSNTLEQIEGIQAANNGATTAKPVIRGYQANRIVIVSDNVKQEEQQWANSHGLSIDQFEIDRAILIKGPSALVYGSDAIGGVLKFEKDHSIIENSYEAQTIVFYRSVNNTIGAASKLKLNKKGHYLSARFGFADYGDYKIPADTYSYLGYVLPIYNNTLKNTAGKELNGALTYGKNFDKGFSRVTISNFHQTVGVFPGATGLPTFYNLEPDGNRNVTIPSQKTNHFKIASESNIALNYSWLEMTLAYQNNQRQELGLPAASGYPYDDKQNLQTALNLNTTTGNLTLHLPTHKKHEDIIGAQASYQVNQSDGFEYALANYKWFNSGVYAIKKWKKGKNININVGLRLDYTHIETEQVSTPFYSQLNYVGDAVRATAINKNYFSWAANFGISHKLHKNHSYKINLGKAFRAPQAYELTANGAHSGAFRFEQGNPNLTPENAYQLDFVYDFEKSIHHLKFSPFLSYLNDYIYLTPSNQFATVEVNGVTYPFPETGQRYDYLQNNALIYGSEFLYHMHPLNWLKTGVQGDIVVGQNITETLPLPLIPPARIRFFGTVEKKIKHSKGYITLNATQTFKQGKTDRNEKKTSGYLLLGIETGITHHKYSVSVHIENLTNQEYLKHLSLYRQLNIPEPAINFNFMFTYKFEASVK